MQLCRFCGLGLFAAAGLLIGRMAHAENPRRPTLVAVFPLECKGLELPAASGEGMQRYLQSKLAESGQFRVIPEDQVKSRLTEQKKSSYRECYDQSCQIEIGQELAAEQSLSAQVIKLGSSCAVTLTLYDLKRAATAGAGSSKGGCDEDSLVASLERAVTQLSASTGERPAANAPAAAVAAHAPAAPAPRISTRDALRALAAPIARRLTHKRPTTSAPQPSLPPRPNVASAPDVATVQRSPVTDAERRHRAMTRTEWVGFEVLGGSLINTGAGGGGLLQIATLKWNYVYWTVLDIGGGGGKYAFAFCGTELGLPIYLGGLGGHQFRVGLGLGVGAIDQLGFMLAPAVSYRYQTRGSFFFGLGVRAFLPVAESTIASTARDRPDAALMLMIPFGWSSSMM